ncbi:MAG: ABC transporter substrate-binding protein [Pseudomonadota bacterium]
MKLTKLLAGTVLSASVAFGATAAFADGHSKPVTVMSWGGAYTKSQVEAYHKPFTEKTGVKINSVDSDNPAKPIKAQVEAGNVTVDVADVEFSDAVRLCDEGLLEPIDASVLPAAPDGTAATDDFIEGALTDCAVANIVWSTIYAYNSEKVAGDKPSTIADFFDTAKFPGKRGMRKSAKANLEMALMADGVPAGEVYSVLETEEGVERAIAKLDSIKDDIVWWEAGAQPPQLLADGEVVMSTAYNGRIFNAAVSENQPFEIVWDGQILDFDLFVIPKGAPNKDGAMEFIKFATATEQLAEQAKWISYGPARKSSGPLVGLYQDGKTEMGPQMPTAAANMGNALVNSFEFWADRDAELSERFNAWLNS